MTDRSKRSDKKIWTRMGAELVLLEELIAAIYTDREYNAIMDMKTWDRLGTMHWKVCVLRSACEDCMAKFVPDWSTRTFFPHERGDICAALEECRSRFADGIANPETGKSFALTTSAKNSNT